MIRTLIERSLQYCSISSCKYSLVRLHQLNCCSQRLSATNLFQNISLPIYKKLSMDSSIFVGNEEELRSRALKLCSEHLGGPWSKITFRDLSLIPVSGGMSNSLFCCSLPESTESTDGVPQQVLLRFYGDIARDNDIAIQLEIFSLLSSKELGPKLYGKFEDGRLEEFLPANSMTCEELMDQEISLIIAKKLAAIHSLDIPIIKNKSWLLDRFNEWIDCIKEDSFDDESDAAATQSTKDIAQELLVIDYRKEIDFLQTILENSPSPTVFSHNDLHQGNILLAKYSKRRPTLEERIVIIDFEYCSYNYRAYDIANHFCEWCFEYDTPEYPHFILHKSRFPSKIVQGKFIRQYLMHGRQLASCNLSPEAVVEAASATPNAIYLDKVESLCDRNNNGDNNLTTINGSSHPDYYSNGIISEKEVDELLEEVQPFFMVANLLWTLWCIKSARSSSIKFGYWEHAMARWTLYSDFKTTYLAHGHEASGDSGRNFN